MKTPDRKVVNSELDGYITFRLAVPKTVTEKYAQIVHKSAGYSDSSISNLEIQNKGTDNAYISVKVRHFSEFDVTFTNSRVALAPPEVPAAAAEADPIRLPQKEHG